MAATVYRMLCTFVLFGFLSVFSSVEAHRPLQPRTNSRGRSSEDGLLPRDCIPYHYDIDITPDIYRPAPPFPFNGTVNIHVECFSSTKTVTVDYYLITILTVDVAVSPDSAHNPPDPGSASFTLEPDADFVHISVDTEYVNGAKYIITITYSGELTNNGEGIYYDEYTAADGSTKYILATQLEDIAARQMYPCYDEPDLKATFNVTVAHMPAATALSNMPVIATEQRADGWVANVYGKSPIMSTYQVCVCIGELVYVEANWQGIVNYPVRIYSRPEVIHLMDWVAGMAVETQRWLEIETGIVYDLPKMDHIALPTKGGAMENWGLITYGEMYFAVNEETSSLAGTQYIGMFASHELAHQWYGNLVTCQWWTDIWLNEGFASYYDYHPMEHLGWLGTYRQQRDIDDFMEDDQKNTSDPVRKQIDTTWDAWYSFSGSTYPKGSAMVRMLEGILTSPSLKTALSNYLNLYQYSSAVTDDLWQVLTDQATADGYPLDIKTIMDPWLNQMGLPLVTMIRNGDGTATLTQNYLLHPPNQDISVASQWNYKWTIPIRAVTAGSSVDDWSGRPTDWFDIAETEKILTGLPVSLSDWVLINPRRLMYYRVNYDDSNRAAIVSQLISDHTAIQIESRRALIDDSFTIARASYIPETTAMETTRYLGNERHLNPWDAAIKYTSLTSNILKDAGVTWTSDFTAYMLSILEPTYYALGWSYSPAESADDQTLRRQIVASTCNYGQADCSQNSLQDYQNYKLTPNVNSINPNNLPTTLCTGVAQGTDEDWNLIFDQYQQRRWTPVRDERYAYLFGLACSYDTVALERLLSYIVAGTMIDSRDHYYATRYLAANDIGEDLVWNYFDNQWPTVPWSMYKFTVTKYITETWADQASLDKLNALIAKYPPATQSEFDYFNHMQLTVQQNIDWLAANHDSLRDWVTTNTPPAFSAAPTTKQLPVNPTIFWSTLDRDHSNTQSFRK